MAKTIIYLDRVNDTQNVALWATVPAALQPKYQDPAKGSAFRGASPAELDALRAGTVAESVGSFTRTVGMTQAQMDSAATALFTGFQNQVNAEDFSLYGRFFDATWQNPGALPPRIQGGVDRPVPNYILTTVVSALAANKFHLVLFNNTPFFVVRVQLVVVQYTTAGVTGVLPGPFTLRRREGPTTSPAGGGAGVSVAAADSFDNGVPSGLSGHNNPTTAPAGGTLRTLLTFVPQGDEVKLATLDATTQSSLLDFGGTVLWDASRFRPRVPLTIRGNQTLEIQQDATGGTGNVQFVVVASLEDNRA